MIHPVGTKVTGARRVAETFSDTGNQPVLAMARQAVNGPISKIRRTGVPAEGAPDLKRGRIFAESQARAIPWMKPGRRLTISLATLR